MNSTRTTVHTQSGRITVWMVLGIVIVATLVILGVVIAGVVKTSQANQETNHRNALRMSDLGIQDASIKLAEDPAWMDGFAKPEGRPDLNEWYTVTISRTDSAGTIRVTLRSTGHCGSATSSQVMVLRQNPDESGGIRWERESMRQE